MQNMEGLQDRAIEANYGAVEDVQDGVVAKAIGTSADLDEVAKEQLPAAIPLPGTADSSTASEINNRQPGSICTDLPPILDPRQEAKDSLLVAMQKMEELQANGSVDFSRELSRLNATIDLLRTNPSITGSAVSGERARAVSPVSESLTSTTPSIRSPRSPPTLSRREISSMPPRPPALITPPPIAPPPISPLTRDFNRLCEVERLLMTDWRTGGHAPEFTRTTTELPKNIPIRLAPVIQVFYQDIPESFVNPEDIHSNDHFKEAHTISQYREKPHRVKINSRLLITELKRISGLELPFVPFLMTAPFKLLLYSWPSIESALQRLKDEATTFIDSTQKSTTTVGISEATGESSRRDATKETANTETVEGNTVCENAEEAGGETSIQKPIEEEAIPDTTEDEGTRKATEERHRKLQLRIKHLQCLINFIKSDLGYLIGLKMKIQDGSLDMVAFDEVPFLYPPGQLVLNREGPIDSIHQVYATTGGRVRLTRNQTNVSYQISAFLEADTVHDAAIGSWTDVVVHTFRTRWDGVWIGPVRALRRIAHFLGYQRITDFSFYPLHFRENAEKVYQALVRRGQKYVDCSGHKRYEGPVIQVVMNPPNAYPERVNHEVVKYLPEDASHIESDVFVDITSFVSVVDPTSSRLEEGLKRVRPAFREVSETAGNFEISYAFGDHEVDSLQSEMFVRGNFELMHPSKIDKFRDTTHLALLPIGIPVYVFHIRKWAWLRVDRIGDIDQSEEAKSRAWKDLVIRAGYGKLLLSLVENQSSSVQKTPDAHQSDQLDSGEETEIREGKGRFDRTAQIDIIKGKGRGLIILLHGPPGTGKTSTAEAIAAYTAKPLYAITCGDLGVSPDDLEESLVEHMKLAQKWDCVLLLDEADVFLARRRWDDVQRNALVSVFLRQLEYYSGILFLTTNIVGLIDEAFKSRIHIALRYDVFNWRATEKIWRNHLRRIQQDNEKAAIKIVFNEESLLEFAQEHHEEHEGEESTWNARQIRNAFSSAVAMGQHDRLERIAKKGLTPDEAMKTGLKSLTTIRLTRDNFEKIAEIADGFEQYIKGVRGDDVENALNNQQRDDFYGRRRATAGKLYREYEYGDEMAQPSRRRGHGALTRHYPNNSLDKKTRMRREDDEDESDDAGEGKRAARRRADILRAGKREDEDDEVAEEEEGKGKGKRAARHKSRITATKEFSEDDDEADDDDEA